MGRIIDLRTSFVGDRLELEPGDLVLLPAAGARVVAGSAVECGVHQNAIALEDGRVLAPQGAPDVVALTALASGDAMVRLFTGDPFGAPVPKDLEVVVRAT